MNRWLWVCVLFVVCLVGCGKTSNNANSANQSANKPSAAGSSISTTTTAGDDEETEETDEEEQGDVTGAYFPDDVLPDEFSEIDHLSLATIDAQGNPAPLNGFIRPRQRAAKDYKLVDPKLEGKKLTFSTSTIGGIGYSFTGTFEKLDDFSAQPPPADEVVLKGTLTKTSDGEEVAETQVSFTYSAGG